MLCQNPIKYREAAFLVRRLKGSIVGQRPLFSEQCVVDRDLLFAIGIIRLYQKNLLILRKLL